MSPIITLAALRAQPNNPNRKGELASRKITFGPWSRYAVYAIHTRFDSVQFIVADAEVMDGVTNRPSVIRQSDTLEQALHGLDLAK